MAISLTYLTLQRQIADELGDRSDLLSPLSDSNLTLSPIQNAIQQAIAKWEREPFYFNEVYDTDGFSTADGQEFYGASTSSISYALIGTMAKIDKAHVLINGQRYTLIVRLAQYLEDISVNPSVKGFPVDISYYAQMLRFYPIPDGAYPVTLQGIKRFTALSADSDTNVWTQDACDLIRCEAKLILAQEVLHDPALAAECKVSIYGDPSIRRDRGYLGALKGETTRRTGRGGIRPSHF